MRSKSIVVSSDDASQSDNTTCTCILLAAFFVALEETSIIFPKNFACPSVTDALRPSEITLAPSKRKEIHFAGLTDRVQLSCFQVNKL